MILRCHEPPSLLHKLNTAITFAAARYTAYNRADCRLLPRQPFFHYMPFDWRTYYRYFILQTPFSAGTAYFLPGLRAVIASPPSTTGPETRKLSISHIYIFT